MGEDSQRRGDTLIAIQLAIVGVVILWACVSLWGINRIHELRKANDFFSSKYGAAHERNRRVWSKGTKQGYVTLTELKAIWKETDEKSGNTLDVHGGTSGNDNSSRQQAS